MNRKQLLAGFLQQQGLPANQTRVIDLALTHPTYVFENRSRVKESNQRLEFLGDAVVGLVVAQYLYQAYPQLSEGDLTRMRAAVVCEATLASKAQEMGLGEYLLLGKGEEANGGRQRPSILADAFEALTGAIFLQLGWDSAREWILKQLQDELKHAGQGTSKDYKTLLQEIVQSQGEKNVDYIILQESGPDHDKRFTAGVRYRGDIIGRGHGRNKKEAEQKAAQMALRGLRKQGLNPQTNHSGSKN